MQAKKRLKTSARIGVTFPDVWLSNAKMIMAVPERLSGYDFDKRRLFDLTCDR